MGDRPNVFLLVLDTVRRDRAYDDRRDVMPTLRRFAAGATTFTDAVAPASWSVPAHASLFTGCHPGTHGATTVRPVFRAEPTLPGLLSAAGYETYAVSPNQYVRPETGFARGFDEFETLSPALPPRLAALLAPAVNRFMYSPARYPPERLLNAVRARRGTTAELPSPPDSGLVDRVTELVRGASSPFFLFVNLFDAHLPRSPAPEHVDRFVDDDLADAPVVRDERAHKFGPGMDERGLARFRQLYDADLRTVDDRLGLLLDRLSATGVLDDALVVVLSDHGEHLGEFGLVGHQHSVFEPVVAVPLVVSFPAGGPDTVTGQVETRRVFHTVLDETGVREYPSTSLAGGHSDGVTRGAFYSPMLDVEALTWHDTARYDRDLLGEPLSFARTGAHKLVRFDGREWLFSLPETRGESLPRDRGQTPFDRLSGPPTG